MMNDWSTGVETRNYLISRKTDRRSLFDQLASILCLLAVAGALVGNLWIRNRIVNMGYEIQRLEQKEKALRRTQASLICEEEYLTQPQRIDSYARNYLGMEPLKPNQYMTGFRRIEGDRPAPLALASTQPANVPPGRPSANN